MNTWLKRSELKLKSSRFFYIKDTGEKKFFILAARSPALIPTFACRCMKSLRKTIRIWGSGLTAALSLSV